MNTGPYSEDDVQRFIEEEFVPIKSECFWKERTELMKRFDIAWTPTFLIQDSGGKVHRKMTGFLPSDDFLAQLKLGKGMFYFEKERHDDAINWLQRTIKDHPNSGAAPEAVFFLGVARYKKNHEACALRGVYDALTQKYPESEWARRAQPYAAIPEK